MPTATPTRKWLKNTQLILEELSPVEPRALRKDVSLLDRQQAFESHPGRHAPADVADGNDGPGSHWLDGHRHADLRDVGQVEAALHLFQAELRAGHQPADRPDPRGAGDGPSVSFIGPRPNIFDLVGSSRRKRLEVRQPILTNGDLEKIRSIGHTEDRFDTKTLDTAYNVDEGAAGMAGAVERLCDRAEAAVHGGYNIIILSGPPGRAGPAYRSRRCSRRRRSTIT